MELDGNILSRDLASSPTIDVILMRTLMQSGLMLSMVNPSNTETGKQFISGILPMCVKTEKSHKLVNHAIIKNDELTIVCELDNSFVGVQDIPDRLFDWFFLNLLVIKLDSEHLISLPIPVYLTMVHKASTLAMVLWNPLYCTNLSTGVTTLETLNSVAVTGYWCFMKYPCSILGSTSTNTWALYMSTKIPLSLNPRLLSSFAYEATLVLPNKEASIESDNIRILWTSLDLTYLVEASLDYMVTNQWAHRNICSKLSITVAPNRAVNHYLWLDCVANTLYDFYLSRLDDISLLAVLDRTVTILVLVMATLIMALFILHLIINFT